MYPDKLSQFWGWHHFVTWPWITSDTDCRSITVYIVWLSLIWDTDWLNTVTWSTNISVCCPPQSCGGGTLIDTTHFSRKQMANRACDTIASNMYVDRPSRALAFYCAHSTMDTRCTAAHSTMDTHCTAHNLKKIPAEIFFVNFCELCRSRARQWVAIQYNRWRLCCREHHGMFPVSWGLKWYFGKNISPSTSSRDL